jgi:hypothetical protein
LIKSGLGLRRPKNNVKLEYRVWTKKKVRDQTSRREMLFSSPMVYFTFNNFFRDLLPVYISNFSVKILNYF